MSYTMPLATPLDADREKELRNRMPRLQTSPSDANHKSTTSTASTYMTAPAPDTAPAPESIKSPTAGAHRRFVLTDHVAFRYLEEDPSTTVLSRRQQIEGYEVYLVEQWACSREHPTFVITTYTGDPKDQVWASVISVSADESRWSRSIKTYFSAVQNYHARPKETSLGTLMIINLSGFPSSLTVIPIPDGDVKKHRELFFVNENLKRLGCSGRLGIKLAPPSSATKAKFHQLYRTSDNIPLNSAVIELVKLCQVALVLFNVLQPAYADGLLCDKTEKAINDWWVEFGAEYYTVEPHDGILGPTTVAALLGMLMGARNRLSAYNAPVAKDVFDIDSTKRAIEYFQKTQHIERSRRLDRQTLERLRRATAKAASKEGGWNMPRALKSTVAELGGKGGEMVMGIVGAGDKAGIADIETVDIDRFVELVQGERSKWLWYGKPRKTTTIDMFSRLPGEDGAASPEEHRAPLQKRDTILEEHKLYKRDTRNTITLEDSKKHLDPIGTAEAFDKDKDPNSKRAAIRRATDKIESAGGFTRIKDAVGRRNHHAKSSREDLTNGRSALHQRIKSDLGEDWPSATTSAAVSRQTTRDYDSSSTRVSTKLPPQESSSTLATAVDGTSQSHADEKPQRFTDPEESDMSKPPTVENSVAGSILDGIDQIKKLPFEPVDTVPPFLRRTDSFDQLCHYQSSNRNEQWWPRHLSFSIAEESILRWRPVTTASSEDETSTLSLRAQLLAQEYLSTETKRLHHQLSLVSEVDAQWTETQVQEIRDLDAQAEADIQELESLYYPRLESYHALREDAHEIISRERVQLQDAMRDLETLGAKLEYEVHGLKNKVDDVDDGVNELEKQVLFVESRIEELENQRGKQKKEGWWGWGVRMFTGLGRPLD
ncbi:hypothetical protein K491DRAFT_335893 [Lophiostoma macrostomum CBS 122681]|uniref:STB6-like N-terminal domain-containing protein n=1 Tax=Lophiostoma macrostomum CBS 122681 TaxID=1314788 RepID=A0A6A6TTK0_9PLEO|nr:hypothetical protein K491DRAFT_335893 [Lophiostoma macrostomum CBS 122681]